MDTTLKPFVVPRNLTSTSELRMTTVSCKEKEHVAIWRYSAARNPKANRFQCGRNSTMPSGGV